MRIKIVSRLKSFKTLYRTFFTMQVDKTTKGTKKIINFADHPKTQKAL